MNKTTDNFNRVIKKYGFVTPVNAEQQHKAISDSQDKLKSLLKKLIYHKTW